MTLSTRGWGPWRQEFVPHYSAMGVTDHGNWYITWVARISYFTFRHAPSFWVWWTNTPVLRRMNTHRFHCRNCSPQLPTALPTIPTSGPTSGTTTVRP